MRNKLFANKTLLATATLVAIGGSLVSASALASRDLPAQVSQMPAAAHSGRVESVRRMVVTYRDGSTARTNTADALRVFNKALAGSGMSTARLGGSPRAVRNTAFGGTVIALPAAIDRVQAAAVLRQLASDPSVASVEIDEKLLHTGIRAPKSATPSFIPNDPRFNALQWHLKAPDGVATPAPLAQANRGGANLPNAWDLADGSGIVVAVIDTGTTVHSDMDNTLAAAGYDFISDAQTSGRPTDERTPGGWDLGDWTTEEPWISECTNAQNPPDDSSWHGTHVGGTVGAQITNNALGAAGVAYGAKVLPIRALGHCGGYNADINDAIVWAAGGSVPGMPVNPNPAHVINLSLGGGGSCSASSSAGQAVAAANALGAVVVVAAGNHNGDASTRSPASCPGVITVGATGVTGKRAYYSGYGSTVEIAAPGGGVYVNDAGSGNVANPDGFVWQASNGGLKGPTTEYVLGGMAGTSMASPHVAGVVALMQGARLDAGKPLLTPTEVVTLLQQTVTNFPSTPDRAIGPGMVNAHAAVLAAIAHGDDTPGEPGEPGEPTAIELVNKVAVNGVSGGEKLYSFQAAAGSKLTILAYGGSGDVSLYVKKGSEPSATSNDAFSARAGNSETVTITAPTAGTYYIKLTGSYSGLSLVARQ